MSDILGGLAVICAILLLAFTVVFTLNAIGVAASQKPNELEETFRAACNNVKGTTVFNGKHYECLK